jgi:hypothetical protein
MSLIVDTDVRLNADKLSALKNSCSVTAVGRYLDRLDPLTPKVIDLAEAEDFAKVGMPMFPIFEIGGRPAGAAQGQADAQWVKSYLPTIGMPNDTCVANAVDFDAQATDMPPIMYYFASWSPTLAPYRSGGYGSGFVLGQLATARTIVMRWISCSPGFAGTHAALAAGAYDMEQFLSPALDGIDVDVNRLRVPGYDFGARVPFAPAHVAPVVAATPAPSELAAIVARIREIFVA